LSFFADEGVERNRRALRGEERRMSKPMPRWYDGYLLPAFLPWVICLGLLLLWVGTCSVLTWDPHFRKEMTARLAMEMKTRDEELAEQWEWVGAGKHELRRFKASSRIFKRGVQIWYQHEGKVGDGVEIGERDRLSRQLVFQLWGPFGVALDECSFVVVFVGEGDRCRL